MENNKKYTFKEFISVFEYGYDFNRLKDGDSEWAEQFIDGIPEFMKTQSHNGDCVKIPCTCDYCSLQKLLDDYEEYCLNEEEFFKKWQPIQKELSLLKENKVDKKGL